VNDDPAALGKSAPLVRECHSGKAATWHSPSPRGGESSRCDLSWRLATIRFSTKRTRNRRFVERRGGVSVVTDEEWRKRLRQPPSLSLVPGRVRLRSACLFGTSVARTRPARFASSRRGVSLARLRAIDTRARHLSYRFSILSIRYSSQFGKVRQS